MQRLSRNGPDSRHLDATHAKPAQHRAGTGRDGQLLTHLIGVACERG
jgi:hypothetical protein